jgi:hypothetical protein
MDGGGEVSPALKISLLVFALLIVATLGLMVVRSDDLISDAYDWDGTESANREVNLNRGGDNGTE